MKRFFAIGLLLCAATGTAFAAVKGEEVQYQADGVTMKGYIAYDDAVKGRRPAVIVVHEWWGNNEFVRERARRLAAMGYTAIAVDMFGDGRIADNPKTAGEYAGAVRKDPQLMRARFNAARAALEKHATVDAKRMGAIGFCFGGSVVVEMARSGADLAGVAAFHASVPTSPVAVAVKSKVLVMNGDADPLIPAASVAAFKKEMDAAKADYRYVTYPGLLHAFTNPASDENGKKFKMPVAYDAAADKDSWEQMQKFFAGLFKS